MDTPQSQEMKNPHHWKLSIPKVQPKAKRLDDCCLLIADDADDMRLILANTLAAEGHDCLEAASGKQVVQLVKAHRPDLVILDIMMPELNGFQVLLRLENSHLKPAVCVVSAVDEPDFVRRAFEFGACDYLLKPISPDVLRYRVARILNPNLRSPFFGVNCDLQASVRRNDESLPCRILGISESSVTIANLTMPELAPNKSELWQIQSQGLARVTNHHGPIFIKPSAIPSHRDMALDCDFVATPDTVTDSIRKLVARGRFFSDYQLQN